MRFKKKNYEYVYKYKLKRNVPANKLILLT